MNNATVSWDAVDVGAVGDVNIFNGQGIKDFGAGSSAYGVGRDLGYDWPMGGDWDLLETTALLAATATGYCLAGLALAWGAQRLFRRKIFSSIRLFAIL